MKILQSNKLSDPTADICYDLSPEAVAKFCIVEELRLLNSKIDRLSVLVSGYARSESEVSWSIGQVYRMYHALEKELRSAWRKKYRRKKK